MDKQEAIKILKEFHDISALFSVRTALETVFPKLKEPEDEKTGKQILSFLKEFEYDHYRNLDFSCWIAWLEKQKKPEDMVHIAECKVWPANSATTANRQLYNRAILKILSNYVEKYPDIRFGQMLFNLGVKPHFNQESKETYCNLNETINKKS